MAKLIVMTSGSYSDYRIVGLIELLGERTIKDLYRAWFEQLPADQKLAFYEEDWWSAGSYQDERFYAWCDTQEDVRIPIWDEEDMPEYGYEVKRFITGRGD